MARCENHIVFGDAFEASAGRIHELSRGINYRQRWRRNALGRELPLILAQNGSFGIAAIQPSGGFVFRVDRWHPDDLAP